MGKREDEAWKARMAGMIRFMELYDKEGIEAVKHEYKCRRVTRVDVSVDKKEYEFWYKELGANLHNNIMTIALYTLHNSFGFGKDRLKKFQEEFNRYTNDTLDLDYMGEHYVTMGDYAVYLNEKYDLGLNAERCDACQQSTDEKSEAYHNTVIIETMINILRLAGFTDSEEMQYLENKLAEAKERWQLENLENE